MQLQTRGCIFFAENCKSICLRVSEGKPFWLYQTNRGAVLYLCLEDSFNRIRQRLGILTEEAPENLYFAVMANSISDGLIPQIEIKKWIAQLNKKSKNNQNKKGEENQNEIFD